MEFTIGMNLDKETKNTYVFRVDASRASGSQIELVYIKKTAFPNGAPKSIAVTVKV